MRHTILLLLFLMTTVSVWSQKKDTTKVIINDSEVTIITEDDGDYDDEEYDEYFDELPDIDYDSVQVSLRERLTIVEQELDQLKSDAFSKNVDVQADTYRELGDLRDKLDRIKDVYFDYYPRLDPEFEYDLEDAEDRISDYRKRTKYGHRFVNLPNTKSRWFMIDMGLSTYDQNSTTLLGDGVDPLEQNLWRSSSWTIHFFQMRHNIVRHHLNLVYGIGYEFNKYAFDNNIRMVENDVEVEFQYNPDANYSCTRLRADYLQLPLYFNYESNPVRRGQSFRINAGAYLNILTKATYKTKGDGDSDKIRDRFHLRNYLPGILVETGYGGFSLYCKYGLRDLFEEGPENGGYELTPITFGIKLIPF